MSHDWKIGDWAELNTTRYLVYAVHSDFVFGVRPSGTGSWRHDAATHLPDCTGWDWQPPKPIEPPPGYRLMGKDEIVKDGDKYLSGEDWHYANVHGETVARLQHPSTRAYARKIEPQYRPFANDAEFNPHKGRWVYFIGTTDNQLLIYAFNATGVWHAGRLTTWEAMFSQCKFEDGTPFGIATTEKESTCAK